MEVRFHPHALARLAERGASTQEVVATVTEGEQSDAKHGRTAFRRNFPYNSQWRGRSYPVKQVEAIATWEDDAWLVITVIVRFF